jgi:hypothetical protein
VDIHLDVYPHNAQVTGTTPVVGLRKRVPVIHPEVRERTLVGEDLPEGDAPQGEKEV